MSETLHTAPRSTQPLLPMADHPPYMFAGFVFEGGDEVPARPGLYVLSRQIGPFCYPVLMGEAEDMASAIEELRTSAPADAREVDSIFWLERTQARQRAYVLKDLIGRYNPPLNVEHRKAPAAPDVAALVPDRMAGEAFVSPKPIPLGEVAATEAEIEVLVRRFYAAGGRDPVLGPVFSGIRDFETHVGIICDFWSRQLLGTERYKGNPFSAHIHLGLVPEHFNRWIEVFNETAREVLQPDAAERAIAKVEHMSHCFQTGLFLPEIRTTD